MKMFTLTKKMTQDIAKTAMNMLIPKSMQRIGEMKQKLMRS